MPFEVLTVIEALATATSLLPSNYQRKYRALASLTATQLISALEASVHREPFSFDTDEKSQFVAAKSKLVQLISDSPEHEYPLHEALKPILTEVLAVSRSLRTGTLEKT